MVKFWKLWITVLVSISLLTACAQKPQYYQAVYAKGANPNKNTAQGRKNTTQPLSSDDQKDMQSKSKVTQQTSGFDRDAFLMMLALPFILIIGGIAYEISKDDQLR